MRLLTLLTFITQMSLLSLLAVSSSAHLDGGVDQEVGDFVVDFGYSPEHPRARESTLLAFTLFKAKEIVEPSSVWVRISDKEDILFAGNLYPENKHVAFSYAFPETGDYDITTKFEQGNELLVESEVTIHVERDLRPGLFFLVFFVAAGMLTIYARFRRK